MSLETPQTTQMSELTVSFLDVGKGDCIIIENAGKTMMIDAGYDETSEQIMEYLSERGVKRLDWLLITHYDKDHVGGAADLIGEMPVGEVILPPYEGSIKGYKTMLKAIDERGQKVTMVDDDMEVSVGEASCLVLASTVEYEEGKGGEEGNDNDVSLVVKMTYGEDSYLFTGDLEKKGLKAYLARGLGKFDVLKMPHHGEFSGRLDDLLEEADPKVAVITDSKDEPADKKTTDLLEELEIESYCTATDGTVVIRSDGTSRYQVTTIPS